MTATLKGLATPAAPASEQDLHLERTDIWFYDVGPNRVGINVTLRNLGAEPSRPTTVTLQAAPLGAFVSWEPLVALAVPALRPGEAVDLNTEAARPQPAPLGDFADVPPRRVLAAMGSGARPSRAAAQGGGLFRNWSLLRRLRRVAGGQPARSPSLPPDPLELLGRRNPHWAGNLNVFIGRRSVERHLARALRIYPGRTNLAMFIVGSGPDAYAFELRGDGAAWEAALYDKSFGSSLLVNHGTDHRIRPSEWVPTHGRQLMILAVCPPEGCQRGTLEVHVTQQSTGKTAVVEFSLDPEAAGPGCYVV
jgi:hypothetical protein